MGGETAKMNFPFKTRKEKALLATLAILIIALAAVVVYSQTLITAPEHITGDPQPTPTPTATESPTPPIAELHLTGNNTDPFYKGDVCHMEATLTPAEAGVTVTLYNNGNEITTALTNSSGVATFDRVCNNPFDFTAVAELP